MSKEMVIHPKHYNKQDRKECWEEMMELFLDESTIDGLQVTIIFDVMSAYKYWYRAGDKEGNPEEQDIAKINNYIEHARTLLPATPSYCLARRAFSAVCSKIL